MKRKLNFLCVIVMLVLSYSVLEAVYFLSLGFKTGIELGMNSKISAVQKEELMHLETLHLLPKDMSNSLLKDSILNEKSGQYVPVSYDEMIVSVNAQPSFLVKSISVLAVLGDFVTVIWAVILFIRIIIAINKSEIFNWRNVRRLRRLGVLLIIGFACSFLKSLLTVYNVEKVLSLTNYSLSIADMVHTTSLVLGLSALIVAEVFAIGLRIKEEQELTI